MEPAMKRKALMLATSAALAFSLAGCGGGGGDSHVDTIPPPPSPPTPPPPPTPTPATAVIIFPDVTSSTQFATLGYEAASSSKSPGSLVGSGFSVSYDASAKAYTIDVPSAEPGKFVSSTSNDSFWEGDLGDPDSLRMNVLKPSPTNPAVKLSYTTFASYGDIICPWDCQTTYPYGFVAFGSATPSGAVPVSGNATYSANVAGIAADVGYFYADGSATLDFNFGAGTLGGHMDAQITDGYTKWDLGRYDFVNTVFGVGSTSFSGELSHSGTSSLGAFNGIFTGPSAQELMARWSAPYLIPVTNDWSTMFGVWVGKKGP
jgi:hypothetical protein